MIQTQLIIVQPTPLCNLNCRYCYLPHRSLKKRMNMQTLERVFETFFESIFVSQSITVIWHAGEPLSLPTSFYEQAFQCIQQLNTRNVQVTHAFQTNATLIDQEWCDFFKQYGVCVGISMDGPQHIHDANRVNWSGKGTFEHAIRGVSLLKQNAIPFSAIAVISKSSLAHAEEIWRFFWELQPVQLGLNPEEGEGSHSLSSLQEEDIPPYRNFLKCIFALNAQVSEPLVIREVEEMINHVKANSLFTRLQTNVPGAILSFDCDGNVSTFSPEMLTTTHPAYGDFIFGNVFRESLETMLKKDKFININAQIQQGVYKCLRSCKYFMFCGGGSPSNKVSEHSTFDTTETQACRFRIQATADVLLEHWEEKYQL